MQFKTAASHLLTVAKLLPALFLAFCFVVEPSRPMSILLGFLVGVVSLAAFLKEE